MAEDWIGDVSLSGHRASDNSVSDYVESPTTNDAQDVCLKKLSNDSIEQFQDNNISHSCKGCRDSCNMGVFDKSLACIRNGSDAGCSVTSSKEGNSLDDNLLKSNNSASGNIKDGGYALQAGSDSLRECSRADSSFSCSMDGKAHDDLVVKSVNSAS